MKEADRVRAHDHVFGQDIRRSGEWRSGIVIVLTVVTMVVEIAAGLVFGSMALLADGLHMASHALALGLTFIGYIYARRRAHDRRFSFGTGKVNALAGFASSLLLGVFALVMAIESIQRLISPIPIQFDQAIIVASLGLLVNGVSVVILGGHGHGHDHGHEHDRKHDHNLKAAYLHVIADALTSILAIVALSAGKYLGWNRLDPVMGIAGALLVTRWAIGLLRESGRVLLDRQAPAALLAGIRAALEREGMTRVLDLHVWSIGPGIMAASIILESEEPLAPDEYRSRLPDDPGLVHVTIEVNRAGSLHRPGEAMGAGG